MQPKTIWITGASSGIGKALALTYAPQQPHLILSSRRKEELELVAAECQALGASCYVLPLDLAALEHPEAIVKEALSVTGRVDILINNGGVSQRGLASETRIEVVRKIMEVNFMGQVALSSLLLPEMIKAGGGQMVVISSVTGKFAYGLRSAYAASKHALHGYFESLAIENAKNNVQVTMVVPGRILTNISLNALNADGDKHGQLDEGQKNGVDVMVCARKIIRAVGQKKREVLIGKTDLLMVYLRRFFPAWFFRKAVSLDPWK